MKKNYKVSIIVAIYKSEKFLPKLIDSILNQTYKNFEVILVDDGSPDNSGLICDEYARKDSRIKVIHKKNEGACKARNAGLDQARGEYVTIIDGDDWLSSDYIEYLVRLLENSCADMAMTDSIFTTRNQEQNKIEYIKKISNEDAICALIYPYIPIGPWNKLYKLSIIKNNNIDFDVPWSGEGLYFSIMVAQYSKSIVVGHRKIYNYRLNNINSGLTKYNVNMGINALNNIKDIKKSLIVNSYKIINAINWHIWKNYNFLLKLILATNNKNKMKNMYIECKKNIRNKMINLLFYSKVNFKGKINILITSLFPSSVARFKLAKEQYKLNRDLLK